jgi:hypothetical protein
MRRVILLTALLSLAFAPEPLQKAQDSTALNNLVGTWRVSRIYTPPDKNPQDLEKTGLTHISITSTGWVFKGAEDVSYDLRIDNTKDAGEFDLMNVGQKAPFIRGLIRREGRAIRVIYTCIFASPNNRPTGFVNQQSGCELLLVRE